MSNGTGDRWLPDYENNVFLSYRHADNTGDWITALHASLDTRIAQLLGIRKGGVWRDPSLQPGDALWQTIEPEIERSALFISVLSPGYVNSENCLREAKKFRDYALTSGGLLVDTKSRWIRVVKTPYEAEKEPPFLKEIETITLSFYQALPQAEGQFREFHAQEGRPGYEQFAERAEALAQSAAGLLQKMQRKSPKPSSASRPRVFLADTTSDRQADRAFVAAELASDCDVVPSGPSPIATVDEIEARTAEHVKDCVLALHIFGARFGAQPEGEEKRSVPQIQFENAAATMRLVWIPDDVGELEPRQAELCKAVEAIKSEGLEVVRSGRQGFLQHARDVLTRVTQPQTTAALGKSVYLVSDQKDLTRPQLRNLANCLMSHGFFVEQPVFDGDLEELRQAEAQTLLDADATVIYFGTARDAWVRSRRRQILKTLGELNLSSRHLRAVYLCSPDTDVKRAVYFNVPNHQLPEPGGPSLWVLGDCTDFQCDKMAPLFEKLVARKDV